MVRSNPKELPEITDNPLRLSHTIGSGLTSLDLIHKTLLEVPNFPWLKLYKRYGTEFANVLAAFATVGSNIFYGYRRDMGAAAASNYKRLAWACSKILYTDKSSHTMKGFKGLTEPEDAEMIMTLINTWRDHEKAEIVKDLEDDTKSRMFFSNLCEHLAVYNRGAIAELCPALSVSDL